MRDGGSPPSSADPDLSLRRDIETKGTAVGRAAALLMGFEHAELTAVKESTDGDLMIMGSAELVRGSITAAADRRRLITRRPNNPGRRTSRR
jgi:hypothetical protein